MEFLFPGVHLFSHFILNPNLPILKTAHVWGNGTSAVSALKCLCHRYLHVLHGRAMLYLTQTSQTQSVSGT